MTFVILTALLKLPNARYGIRRLLSFTGRALCIALAFGVVLAQVTEAAIVRFKSPVTASSSVIRLSDLAEIHGADARHVAQLESIEICPSPASGRNRRLDFETVRARLAARGINLADLEFSGDSVILVNGPEEVLHNPNIQQVSAVGLSETAQRRAEKLLEQAVGRFVRQQAPQVGTLNIRMRLTDEQASQLLTSVNSRLQVAGGRAPWIGPQEFVVRTIDNRGNDRQFAIRCIVNPLPQIPVVRFNIAKGQVLKEEDLTWQQIEKPADLEGAITQPQGLIGQETRRSLRAGKPITPQDIRGVPMIRSGELITIYSQVGGIIAQMTAKAAGDGSYGELIQAQSIGSRDRLVVRVAGYHKAYVVTSEDVIRREQQAQARLHDEEAAETQPQSQSDY